MANVARSLCVERQLNDKLYQTMIDQADFNGL